MRWLSDNRGQAGLVVLLLMTVFAVVGLSVATRSVSEIKITEQEQESTRALNLAETGIEDLLSQDLSMITPGAQAPFTEGNVVVERSLSEVYTVDKVEIESGHSFEVKLERNGGEDVRIVVEDDPECWGLVVAVVNSGGVRREARRSAGCEDGDGLDGIVEINLPWTIGVEPGDEVARIKALKKTVTVSVEADGGGDMPTPQGHILEATAVNQNDTARSLRTVKYRSQAPSIFDYVLFSGDTIVK